LQSLTKLIFLCLILFGNLLQAQDVAEQEPVEPAESEQLSKINMWKDTLVWLGDFRLRFDGIDEQGAIDRNRFRFRGRFGFASQITDNTQLTVRIATSDGNPVSTNLTFGDGFSTKDIAIDRAFLRWNVQGELDVTFGKMSNPWFRAGGSGLAATRSCGMVT